MLFPSKPSPVFSRSAPVRKENIYLQLLVAVRVGLHGLDDQRRELQLLLLQWRPELGGQNEGRERQRGLLLLAQLRLLLADVGVDPP